MVGAVERSKLTHRRRASYYHQRDVTPLSGTTDSEPARIHRAGKLCSCLKLFSISIILLCTAYTSLVGVDHVELQLMRFFRDISRARAQRNLQSGNSLISILTGSETILPPRNDRDDGVWMTAEELSRFTGEEPDSPIYISIKQRIYDVTAGRSFYGPGRSYHHFAGRDATRAFATGCTSGNCLVSSLVGLDDFLLLEIERWAELYEYHDKYKFVGTLIPDPVDNELEKEYVMQELKAGYLSLGDTPGVLFARGKKAYSKGDMQDATALWGAALVRLGEAQYMESRDATTLRVDILGHKASMLQRTGRHGEAVEVYEEAIATLREAIGSEAFMSSSLGARTFADQAAGVYMMALQETTEDAVERSRDLFRESVAMYDRAVAMFSTDQVASQLEVVMQSCNTRINFARLEIKENNHSGARTLLHKVVIDIEAITLKQKKQENLEKLLKALGQLRSVALEGLKTISKFEDNQDSE